MNLPNSALNDNPRIITPLTSLQCHGDRSIFPVPRGLCFSFLSSHAFLLSKNV
nr:MAG TPA: hypothetical protein [Caudoviricetes sp.]